MLRKLCLLIIIGLSGVFTLPSSAVAQQTIEPPILEFVGDRSVEATQTLGINVYAYSQSEEVPWLWAESLPSGAEFFDRGEGFRTFLWYPGPSQVGQHTVKFIAADARDQRIRTEREVVITVTPGTVVSQAFSIVAPDEVEVLVGQSLSVVITATDSNGTVPSLTASGMPEGATLDDNGDGTRSLNWTPTSAQFGVYFIRFNAVSANFSNISTGHDMRVSVIGRVPLISFPVSPGVEAGEVLSFPVRVTRPSGAVPALTIDPLPANATFSDNLDGSRQFTWATTEADIGTHVHVLTALDPLTGLSSTIDLYLNVLADPSTLPTQQTLMLNSDVQSLELTGARLDEPFEPSNDSTSASAGFMANEVEIMINGDTTYSIDLLPGLNSIALESVSSAQRLVLTIDRASYPSIVTGDFPATFAIDLDDNRLVSSANESRPSRNAIDVYGFTESSVQRLDLLGNQTDFIHATSIDISGNTLAVASREGPQAGVWIYERSSRYGWQFTHQLSADPQRHPEGFGTIVALDNDTLAIAAVYDAGASGSDPAVRGLPGAGAVVIYQRDGGAWRYQTTLKAPVPESNDYFGSSLALEGDTLVVGAIGEDSSGTGVNSNTLDNGFRENETPNVSAGAVFVFEREDNEWRQTAYLKPGDNPVPAMGFGHTVSVFEDSIAVSALFATRSAEAEQAADNPDLFAVGAVYLFDRHAAGWIQTQKFEPPANNWRFGLDIDLKKNQLSVLTQARAYFYERHGSEWLLLWDENIGRSLVTFNHQGIVFGAPNARTIIYRSERPR